ncbi:MAG TPA: DNA-processing protein DprA [Ilumatobacter sp.]|nr:DNA-processing protein DprA [Ilumatobacter sp.]
MEFSDDRSTAALLLTNRLVPLDAKPLTAREFWQLTTTVDPSLLLHEPPERIAQLAAVGLDDAQRLRALLDAATAFSFERERLHDGGVALMSAFDTAFPGRLRERLGNACPPFLLVAGPSGSLDQAGLGVVGSRQADDDALAVARQAAELAAAAGWPVVSGLAAGVDQAAMTAALDAGGAVVGIPTEGILRVARQADVRRRVHAGELCLASPYAPGAPFRAGGAMGRNKLIYALSQRTLVVAADDGRGGTWSGATEALDRGYSPIAVWTGRGAQAGNAALARRGATPLDDIARLLHLDIQARHPPDQPSLF